jgi:HK97 family phage prohead protease
MPYFISDATDCPSWAVVKADGEVIACHESKESAIDQMVALSLDEDIEPGGELRAATPPGYIRGAARKGLEYNRAGLGGDGLTDQTIREARLMADGTVSDSKAIRTSAWGARHAVDLEAPQNRDPQDPGFPGAGAVAHYLWGIDPLDPGPARAWFDNQAKLIREGEMASSRIVGGEPIIISDIDGTILNGDTPIAETVAFLQETEEDVYIVTGRNEEQRAATVRALAAAGVEYEELIMNPGSTSDTLNFKRETAQRLLEEYDVVLAVENNASMRRMYRALGIKAVNVGELPPATRKAKTVMETRAHFVDDMEIRAVGDKMTFKGYAAVFDSDSEPLPFIERIRPGAFARTLKSRNNVRMYVNHNDSQLLASTRSGTLRLKEDSKGLLAEADLPMTTDGRNMSILLEQRIVDSMSFGFSVPRGGDTWSADGSRRTLTEISLFEVSVVTGMPAYAATSAGVRKLAARVAVDEVTLAAALVTLESGEELDAAQADLIRGVVDQLAPKDVKPDNSLIVAKQLLALMEMQV